MGKGETKRERTRQIKKEREGIKKKWDKMTQHKKERDNSRKTKTRRERSGQNEKERDNTRKNWKTPGRKKP